jgi:ketosteroid isomerase-like protein
MSANADTLKRYLERVQRFEAFTELVDPDIRFLERPNRLNGNGQERDLRGALEGLARGRALLSQQSYEVTNQIESGDTIVVEALWKGTLAIDAGPLKKDQTLEAFLCMVFEFRGGKIHRQRNYDCYPPF